ncbi:MAG TPA: hypothetical protein PLP17_04220, partial [Oligoflexia bacterium]|nr:hypothetical protein [Oligoflexia bacterium]
RRPWRCNRFSLWKRVLQLSGNLAVSALAARIIPDAVSGFRAYSRKALLSGSIETPYTYTVESVLKCCYNGLRVAWIPIEVNPPTRSSRLMRHPLEMVFRCAYSALRVSLSMRPLRTVLMLALPLLAVGALALQRLPVVQTMYTTLYRLPVDDKALFTPSLLLAAFFGATLVLVIIRSFCLRRTRRTLAHSDMV